MSAVRILGGGLFFIILGIAGCEALPAGNQAKAETSSPVSVPAQAELPPTEYDGANMAAIVADPSMDAGVVILGTDELGGVNIYSLGGEKLGAISAGEADSVDVRYGFELGGAAKTIVSVLDAAANELRFFSFANGEATDVTGEPIVSDFATQGLCLYKDSTDQNLYAFVVGDEGEIDQWLLYDDGTGKIAGRMARRLNLASEVGYCAANDRTGELYVSEQAVGAWKFSANPETDAAPEVIDVRRLGNIAEETGGLAVISGGAAGDYLLASNASINTLTLYDIDNDHAFVGSVQIGANGGVDGVEEPGGLFAYNRPLKGAPNGLLVVADDDNGDELTNYKLVSLGAIADALGVDFGEAPDETAPRAAQIATVFPSAESAPVGNPGDAADDPAIWVHPSDPSLSTVIGTEKQSGLYVYDLSGKVIQYLPDGKMNNVDLRSGFMLDGKEVTLVTASNRTDQTLAIYAIDEATRKLVNVADGPQDTGMVDPYGSCMHQSADGTIYTIINDSDGNVKQWALSESSKGRVSAELKREFSVGSQTEGCVADDARDVLFIGEEAVGVWKYGASPESGDAREAVVMVDDDPALTADVEGLSIYHGENGGGYLVVSSQGSNSYVLYDLEAPHAYAGDFAVIADGARGIDGASETDGLDVTSANLGGAYPKGLLVVQDGRNMLPPENQNFKFVSWADIEQAVGLK